MGERLRVLAIHLGRMGDLVQVLPVFRQIRATFPECETTLLCWPDHARIIRGSPLVSRLASWPGAHVMVLRDPSRQMEIPRILESLPTLSGPFDLVLNLTQELASSVLAAHIPARRKAGRISSDPTSPGMSGRWACYLYALSRARTGNTFHLADVHTGMAGVRPQVGAPWLDVPIHKREKAQATLQAAGIADRTPLVMLQPGSRDPRKMWPASRFAAVARGLLEEGTQVAILGSPLEVELAQTVSDMAGVSLPSLAGIPGTGPTDLPALLSCANLLVTNDTGPMHVAAAVGTPTLSLFFGQAWYAESAPYASGHVVVQAVSPCNPCYPGTTCSCPTCMEPLDAPLVLDLARWMLGGPHPRTATIEGASVFISTVFPNGSLCWEPIQGSRPSLGWILPRILRSGWEELLGWTPSPPPPIPRSTTFRTTLQNALQESRKEIDRDSSSPAVFALAPIPLFRQALTTDPELENPGKGDLESRITPILRRALDQALALLD